MTVDGITALFEPSVSIKVVEVAKKYEEPEGTPMLLTPEYTIPGGPNSYFCSENKTAWTQGFFPGLLWLLVERLHLLPTSINESYSEKELITLARRYQQGFEYLKRPSINHDQGFRDFDLTDDEHAKDVLIPASDSLVDRFHESAGCIRSWDEMIRIDNPDGYTAANMDQHYLVIIDNMMNLDLLYQATEITGNPEYARIASAQAGKSMNTYVRPDGTTNHVVNMDQVTGEPLVMMTHQGYADESCWSRGQAWAMYGYAQCDFRAPKPCPYDASAATVAARGLQMLYHLLLPTESVAAEYCLSRAFKLIEDTLRECSTPAATLRNGKVDFGSGGWETILKHSTINGNDKAPQKLMDHGLVYADYYLVEFGNEALKMGLYHRAGIGEGSEA